MPAITMRKLSRDTAAVLDRLGDTREPILITRNGQPVAALSAVDAGRAENLILATAPRFREAMARADEDAAAGEAKTFDEIFATEPTEAGESGASNDPARSSEGYRVVTAEYAFDDLDPAVFEEMTRAVLAYMPLASTSLETASRIHDLALSYAEAIVAENIENMRRAIREVGMRIIDASTVGKNVELERYEQMLEKVTAAGQLSAHLHKP